MNQIIPVGTRVRAASTNNVGLGFRGQVGTLVQHAGYPDYPTYFVNFDFTDSDGAYANGGSWGNASLEVIEQPDETIARLTRDLEIERAGISSLKADRDEAREVRDSYRVQRDAAHERLEECHIDLGQLRTLATQRGDQRDEAREQRDVARNEARIASEAYDQQRDERDRATSASIRLDATLDYARSFLSDDENNMVDGFNAGWNAGRS